MTAELRSAPRARHAAEPLVMLNTRAAVRVVNISLNGVMLETSETTDVTFGDRLELTVPLAGSAFTATLSVRRQNRHHDEKNVPRLRVGCSFVDMDADRRQQLAQFLAGGLLPPQTERRG